MRWRGGASKCCSALSPVGVAALSSSSVIGVSPFVTGFAPSRPFFLHATSSLPHRDAHSTLHLTRARRVGAKWQQRPIPWCRERDILGASFSEAYDVSMTTGGHSFGLDD